jgi:hypothetical protein
MTQLFEEGGRSISVDLRFLPGDGMKIDRVEIAYGRKFNLGDYNSIELRASFSGPLDPGESHVEAAKELFAKAKAQVREEYHLLKAAMDVPTAG